MSKCTVVWKGQQVIEEMHDVLQDALIKTAEKVLYDAKQNAPIDTGALRRSGCVTIGLPPNPDEVYRRAEKGAGEKSAIETPAASQDNELVVYITFNTPYAAKLHENTNWKPSSVSRRYRKDYKTGEAGDKVMAKGFGAQGGPKYLEKAIPEHWKDFPEMVKKIARMHRKR